MKNTTLALDQTGSLMMESFGVSKTFGVTKSREVETSLGQISLAERCWDEPIDVSLQPAHHWLELQLLPTAVEGRACFSDRWNRDRFEEIGRAYLLPMSQSVR